MKIYFSSQSFEKYSNPKFHEISASGGTELFHADSKRTVRRTDRQTDGHDESDSLFSRKRLITSQLTLYNKLIAVCPEIHTKHTNAGCRISLC